MNDPTRLQGDGPPHPPATAPEPHVSAPAERGPVTPRNRTIKPAGGTRRVPSTEPARGAASA